MINLKTIRHLIIPPDTTLLEAMQRMDQVDKKLLLVMNERHFVSLISIGDIQRAIIKNVDLKDQVVKIVRKNIKVSYVDQPIEEVRKLMFEFRIETMPVLNQSRELENVYFWDQVFGTKQVPTMKTDLDLPVVIMAGGFGSRLRPITNIIPKPLIPLGEKSMLELIIDHFTSIGCRDFYLSVNYKSDFIKYYFDQLENKNYSLCYFKEPKPLGTAGSLSLLKGKFNSTFFVSNCDILINQDLSEIYQYHIEHQNEMTAVAAIKHVTIPYGTLETGVDGSLAKLSEKPEVTYKINSGVYIMESHLLNEIPENTFFHITELMEKLCKEKRRVGVFPVSENSWQDIGTWQEYIKASKLDL